MSPIELTKLVLEEVEAGRGSTPTDLEVARIREAYNRRSGERDRLRYSHFAPAFLFHAQERERKTLSLLARNGFGNLSGKQILEVGCEKGRFLLDLIRWGASPEGLTGVDILPEHISAARSICPRGVSLHSQNVAVLPYRDASFDLVIQGTTFSSIPDPNTRARAASEMLRVSHSTGAILWYDFFVDNPRNRDVRGIRKREILNLFPDCRVQIQKITLAPPIARFVAPRSRVIFEFLSSLRILDTHYLALIRR